jgi:D-aminoacyl-tRNA deacylase
LEVCHAMRVVIQRVSSARVRVGGRIAGQINRGFLVLLGIEQNDTEADGQWLAEKIAKLRVFPDDAGQMNRSAGEVGGDALVVSQFTLHASTQKGTRPSFNRAARPEQAVPLYERFIAQLSIALGRPVQTGEFGAHMDVELVNDGPVTLILDSKLRE